MFEASETDDDMQFGDPVARIPFRKLVLAGIFGVFVLTRLWLLLIPDIGGSDTGLYAQLAIHGVDRQQAVYREIKLEYPPLAWWLFAAPRLSDSKRHPEPRLQPEVYQRYYAGYTVRFRTQLFLVDLVCMGLIWAIGRRMLPTVPWLLPAAYTVLPLVQYHLAYDRLDLGLLLFLLLTFYCWLRSLETSQGANGWAVASYCFLGLGISFKIVPLICVPFLLLADWRGAESAWRIAGRLSVLVIAAVGPFLIYAPSAGWEVLYLFQYHSERGIHLESIWSSLLLAGSGFGAPCSVELLYGGYNLICQWSPLLKSFSTFAQLAAVASLGAWALLRGRRFDRRLALDAALLAIVNSTVLSHVFSPQYLNWLLPVALLLALNVLPKSRLAWVAFVVLSVTVLGISGWLYPWHYTELVELQSRGVMLSVVRSACLVGLAVLLNIAFFGRYGIVPWRTATPAADELTLAV